MESVLSALNVRRKRRRLPGGGFWISLFYVIATHFLVLESLDRYATGTVFGLGIHGGQGEVGWVLLACGNAAIAWIEVPPRFWGTHIGCVHWFHEEWKRWRDED